MVPAWKALWLVPALFVLSAAGPGPVTDDSPAVLNQAAGIIHSVATKASPSVVSITTVKDLQPEDDALDLLGSGSPFNLFGSPGGTGGPGGAPEPVRRAISMGSGVVIDASGLVLTNQHVIENAEKITITFDEHHKVPAVVLGTDPKTDLALVKIKDKDRATLPPLTPLTFADSDQVKVGDWAIAVGSPFGLRQSVTVGIVSATGRMEMGLSGAEDFIQTDAAINPGSSGGPLLNSAGEIIGLNTAIFSQTGSFIGIGFAIPSKLVREIAMQLKENGRVIRGWLGLTAQDLDPKLAGYFNSEGTHGALVTDVEPTGPAGKAHLEAGDVVKTYQGQNVETADQLKALVAKTPKNTEIQVSVIRGGRKIDRKVTVIEAPQPPKALTQLAGQIPAEKTPVDPAMGMLVRDLIPELAAHLSVPERTGALVVGVLPGSPAFDAGVLPGDVVLKAGGSSVRSAKEFNQTLRHAHAQDTTVLYIQRGGGHDSQKIFVPVQRES